MIYVDEVIGSGAPWAGGRSCHMISDESVGELLDFAKRVGLPLQWFQARASIPHFDLSPRRRARAVAAGALEVDRRGLVEAGRRFRERNPSP